MQSWRPTNWWRLDLLKIAKELQNGAILKCEMSGGDSRVLTLKNGDKHIAWIASPHLDQGLRWLNVALMRNLGLREMAFGKDGEWSKLEEHCREYFIYTSELDRYVHGCHINIKYSAGRFCVELSYYTGEVQAAFSGETINEALVKAESSLPQPPAKPLKDIYPCAS